MINLAYILIFTSITLFFFVIEDIVHYNYAAMQDHLHTTRAERQNGLDSLLSSEENQLWIALGIGALCALVGFYLLGTIGSIGFGLLGAWAPLLLARLREARRIKTIELQLVPTLNLLSNSVQSGKTLQQGLEEVSLTADYPISSELSLVARQVRVGLSQEDALNSFADRVPLPDVNLTVQAMIVSLRTGANLPRAIKLIADSVMNRMHVEAKIRVLTAQGKAQGVVLGLAPWAILGVFYLMSPEYASVMFTTGLGNFILITVLILDLLAMFWINKIISIDV
tara:strand:+ start:48415 stop:49260 length:846 start_codon:yes stop_codon:yes gene_type:complete